MNMHAVLHDKHVGLRFFALLAVAAALIVMVFLRLSMAGVESHRSADLIHQFNQQKSIINHISVLSQYFSPQQEALLATKAHQQHSLARGAARNELRDLSRQLLLLTANLYSMQGLMPTAVAEGYFAGAQSPYAMIDQYALSAQKLSQLSADSPDLLALHLQHIKELKPRLNSAIDQAVGLYYQHLLAKVAKPPYGDWLVVMLTFLGFALLVKVWVLKPLQRQMRKADDDAAAANRIKNEFLTSVSHEIRTPMHGIIGAGENLAGTHLDARQSDYIRTILASAESLLDVVNDILGYSSLESGDVHVETLHFDLHELTSDLIQIMNERASLKNLNIILRYEEDAPQEITGDSSLIRQVLYHLLSNAIKFTETGYIVVTVDQVQADNGDLAIKFSVEDTGIGIPEEKQQLIFEQFVQGDGGTKRLFSGTGLGLTIVKKLVALMDGSLKMGSVVGEGSTFSVTLPLRQAGDYHQLPIAPELLPAVKVLWLCDDDEFKNKVLADLGMKGISVVCYSPDTVISDATQIQESITLVAIDYFVQTTSPIKMLQALSSCEPFAACRYVCITRKHDIHNDKRLLGSGFAGVFCLPADTEQLVAFAVQSTSSVARQQAKLPSDAMPAAVAQAHGSSATNGTNYILNASILLVEDNRINATLAQDMLVDFGAQVTVAENGRIAVDKVRSGEVFDLILMDCMMPEMDGFEATRAIRALPQTIGKQLPIIALTANAMAGDKERCLDSGMNAYLSKPVRKKELKNTLNRWLNHRTPALATTPSAKPFNPVVPAAAFEQDDAKPWSMTAADDSSTQRRHPPAADAEPAVKAEQAEPVKAAQPSPAPSQQTPAEGQPTPAGAVNKGATPTPEPAQSRGHIATPGHTPTPEPAAASSQLLYLDTAAVAKAKAMMKRRFTTMIEYFLEDTQNYIEQIYQGINNSDYSAIVVPAHTIKSSSRQMGAIAVSELSKELEALARTEEASFEKFRELADQLQEQFDLSRIDFNYLLSEAS